VALQMNLVLADVRNISATAKGAVPPGSDIDLSALTDAEKSIGEGIQTAHEREKTVRKYLNIVRKVIFIVGACSFSVGIWGLITLLARVRFWYCPIAWSVCTTI
jgi:small nuclear ribonucleoprotein (snRNP)-like protein